MNVLLIFFAIPLATIILSIILQTLICCPFKVAGIAFSIFIVLAFGFGGTPTLIVAAIVYTILSLISAVITMLIQNRIEGCEDNCNNSFINNGNNFIDNTSSNLIDNTNSNWNNNRNCSYRRYN